MPNTRLLLSLFIVASGLVFPAVASEMSVRMELEPATTIAGIPPSIRFVFRNRSESSARVPGAARLLVRRKDRDEFFALRSSEDQLKPNDLPWAFDVAIPAGGSLALSLPNEGLLDRPDWFADWRLLEPGVYELQAEFVSPANTSVALSNVAVLSVAEPAGEDGVVWRLMKEYGHGVWQPSLTTTPEGRAFARRLVTEHPKSSYAPYFATVGVSFDIRANATALRTLLSELPSDEAHAWHAYQLALWESHISNMKLRLDVETRRAYRRSARELLVSLRHITKDANLQARIDDSLSEIDEASPD